jgi:LacI family transcriptional regulator
MSRPSTPRVALLVDTSTTWGRRLIEGVLARTRRHRPWQVWLRPHGQEELIHPPPGWAGEGVIARVSSLALARQLTGLGVPVVNVSAIELPGVTFPRVTTDQRLAARLAVQHFLDRGFRHFGYCGLPRLAYVSRHCKAFVESLEGHGYRCSAYLKGPGKKAGSGDRADQEDLGQWLRRLPRPVGVLTWTLRSLDVLDACHEAGLHVPEDVAILSGAEDELLCEASSPPLSGVAGHAERIGHEAAALLDRLMQGGRPPRQPVLLPPTHVVCRQSTDTLAIDDADLVAAIRFIRAQASRPIQVKDVLRAVPVSRRALERRFRDTLGRTPACEIRHVHLERARQLLAETDMPIPEVAAASGFGSGEYLAVAFKAQTGLSPLRYRTQARVR